MNIKEKLQKLDYSDVYDLWTLCVYNNQEPPKLWQLLDELSDYADADENAAKELSDDIDKLLSPITGKHAKDTLDKILEVGPKSDGHDHLYSPPHITGYYPDTTNEGKQGFTTFDNTTKIVG